MFKSEAKIIPMFIFSIGHGITIFKLSDVRRFIYLIDIKEQDKEEHSKVNTCTSY